MRLDPVGLEGTRQPEAVPASFIGDDGSSDLAARALRLVAPTALLARMRNHFTFGDGRVQPHPHDDADGQSGLSAISGTCWRPRASASGRRAPQALGRLPSSWFYSSKRIRSLQTPSSKAS